jgi:hypothetical protein
VIEIEGFQKLTDKDKIAALLYVQDKLLFEGGKTLQSTDRRRFVFNEYGELVRIQDMSDGAWLTFARAEQSDAED